MSKRGRRSEVDVERLQITLAKEDALHLDRVVRIGKFGRNRNEVAARIINDWLHDKSEAELRSFLARRKSGAEFDVEMSVEGGSS